MSLVFNFANYYCAIGSRLIERWSSFETTPRLEQSLRHQPPVQPVTPAKNTWVHQPNETVPLSARRRLVRRTLQPYTRHLSGEWCDYSMSGRSCRIQRRIEILLHSLIPEWLVHVIRSCTRSQGWYRSRENPTQVTSNLHLASFTFLFDNTIELRFYVFIVITLRVYKEIADVCFEKNGRVFLEKHSLCPLGTVQGR